MLNYVDILYGTIYEASAGQTINKSITASATHYTSTVSYKATHVLEQVSPFRKKESLKPNFPHEFQCWYSTVPVHDLNL